MASVLFYVEAAVNLCNSTTVTQEKAYWQLPSAYKQVKYKPASQVNFSHPATLKRVFQENFFNEARPDVDPPSRSKSQKSSVVPSPSISEFKSLVQGIHENSPNAVILSHREPYSDKFVPRSINPLLPKH